MHFVDKLLAALTLTLPLAATSFAATITGNVHLRNPAVHVGKLPEKRR
jgi:hypothetical protein